MISLRTTCLRRSRHGAWIALGVLAPLAPAALSRAQVTDIRSASGADSARRANSPVPLAARDAQSYFERFRRANLPSDGTRRGGGAGSCDEVIGRWCYWYDESEAPPPAEPDRIREARNQLLAVLDSTARAYPGDGWVAGQRVRYLAEAGKEREAIEAARACRAGGWWCDVLLGLAHHIAGNYVTSDSAYTRALAGMSADERCQWRDITLLLDDVLLQRYRQQRCGTPGRAALEGKVWWLARPLFSSAVNDALTEHYARLTMAKILENSSTPHEMGFDEDERELLLRYGWPRFWTRAGSGGGPNGTGPSIVGHEPIPAYPLLPNVFVFDNPPASDSAKWRQGVKPIRARYAPEYASPMRRLDHQSALFRRGDSALVVLAYDAGRDSIPTDSDFTAALVLTRGDEADATIARASKPTTRGVLTAKNKWEPLLLSAEVTAPGAKRTARARYGIRPPYSVGARVSLSDLLLFAPYGEIPQSVEEVLPHALPSLRVRASEKIGFFWESYGTNPTGEPIGVSLTVAPEVGEEPGRLKRFGRALRLWKEAKPVSVELQDVSARGQATSPRAVVVDISTLKKGVYVVELEIDVARQYKVRAQRTIEVLGP